MNEQNSENKIVAQRIKELRMHFGITQEALAQKLHLTKQAISKIEQGRVALTLDNARRIADIFDVSADWLCGRSNFMNYSPDILTAFVRYEKRKAMKFETKTPEADDDPYVYIFMNYELHAYLMKMAAAENYRKDVKVYNTLAKSAKKEFLEDIERVEKNADGSYCMHPLLLVEKENLDTKYQIDPHH